MAYYLGKMLTVPFDEAVTRTKDALKKEGFGVLTEIDVKETLKKKIGVDFPSYTILGACNPALAHEALKLENKVGTMLPCNVVVRDAGNGQTEVAAVDPVASMLAIDNPELKRAAEQVRAKLERVVAALDQRSGVLIDNDPDPIGAGTAEDAAPQTDRAQRWQLRRARSAPTRRI